MKRITVLLAEDHMVVREGFRKMLELEKEFEVVGEAADGRQAVTLAQKLLPAVILMDIAMPLLNGLEAARQIIKATPDIKIVMLSAHSDDAYVQSATEAGAVGFLLKQTSSQDVCRAILEVCKGKTYFSPAIARHFDRLNPQSGGRPGLPNRKIGQLTSREMEVLQREHLRAKLDIHDTAGLTRYAIGAGIIESSVQLTIV